MTINLTAWRRMEKKVLKLSGRIRDDNKPDKTILIQGTEISTNLIVCHNRVCNCTLILTTTKVCKNSTKRLRKVVNLI